MQKKRFGIAVLLVVLCLSAVAFLGRQTLASDSTGVTGDCIWTVEDGVLTISGEGAMADYANKSEVPWSNEITKVIIENGVTSIGNNSFRDFAALEEVQIPASVTDIGAVAFYGCSALEEVQIPASVKSIGSSAFYNCTGLSDVELADGLESIGGSAFFGCSSLVSIEIPDTVTNIDATAFCRCTGLTNVKLSNNITIINANLFWGCTSLESIEIPEGVTLIGGSAFSGCSNLNRVEIPDSVTSIGTQVFDNTALYADETNWDNGEVFYVDNCLIKADTTIAGEYTIKEGTKMIADSAFKNCIGLTDVVIPDSVTVISGQMFSGCSALESVDIGDGVTRIVSSAFFNCTSLSVVEIPEGVKTIGNSAFKGCTNLNSVTFPESVTHIGTTVLEGTALYEDEANWEDGLVLYVDNCLITAKTTISGEYTITEDVRIIASYAFRNCTGLTIVSIPEGPKYVSEGMFDGCTGLTGVSIPSTVTHIGNYAFRNCSGFTAFDIPDTVTSMDEYVFYGCSGLESIEFSTGLTGIGSHVFYSCTALEEVQIPSNIRTIGESAFGGCNGLLEITFTKDIESIAANAFEGAHNLTIYGYEGTCAEEIALEKGINFESLDIHPTSVVLNITEKELGLTEGFQLTVAIEPENYTVSVVWSSSDEAVATVTQDGYVQAVAGGIAEITVTVGRGSATCIIYVNPFEDVVEGQYYYKPVLWAYQNDITSGYTETNFAPEETCTRAQIVTFLWRNAGRPGATATTNPFADVPADAYYTDAVLWAVENGITAGLTETTFGPEETCTRAQIVTFLWRAFGRQEPTIATNPFADVPSDIYYTKAVLWAVENGITSGLTETTFGPEEACTRGQVVSFLYRAYEE